MINYPVIFHNSIRCWVRIGKKLTNLNELINILIRYSIKNGCKDYIWIYYKNNPNAALKDKIFNQLQLIFSVRDISK